MPPAGRVRRRVPVEVVRAVADGSDNPGFDPFAGITSLAEQSLLREAAGSEGAPRYPSRETVREVILERLAAGGEEAAARDAHLGWFVAFARSRNVTAHGTAGAPRIGRLDADRANPSAAGERRPPCGAVLRRRGI